MQNASVPYRRSVARKPGIEGRMLSAQTSQAVAGARAHRYSSRQTKLPPLMLQPEHIAISPEDAIEDLWRCSELAKEQAH